MIDIHSHILWGLDDGSRSLEQSVEMLRMAAAHGTTDIVATPHCNLEYKYDSAVVAERIAALRKALGGTIRIHQGCDYHFYPESVDIAVADPARYSVNGKGYLLIEFSDLVIFRETRDLLAKLRAAGLTPILTHPERNWLLHPRLEELALWVQEGLLLQVTAQSLSGRFGKEIERFSELLLKRGLVHFIASDAHDTRDRTPRLDKALEWVVSRFGHATAEHLFELNAGCVLRGAPLPEQPPVKETSRWLRLFRR